MTRLEELARKAIQRTSPCTHGMEGDEDLCDGCRYDWERSLISRIEQFGRDVVEECGKVADGFQMTGASPIGPLHGAGWNDAQSRISKAIRALAEEGK